MDRREATCCYCRKTLQIILAYQEHQTKTQIEIQKTKRMELENERLRIKGQQ